MQTVASLAERLDMSAEEAVEKLKYMLFEVEGVQSEIDDAQCDLLIDIDDDDSVAERVRNERLKEIEKKKKQVERLQEASKKAAAKRKAAAKKKAATKKKPAAKTKTKTKSKAKAKPESAEETPEEKPAAVVLEAEADKAQEEGHHDVIFESPEGRRAEILPAEAPEEMEEVPKQEKPSKPAIIIGSAIDHEEKTVDVVRADGSHVDVTAVEETEVEPSAVDESEEDEADLVARAEKEQEEEEQRRHKRQGAKLSSITPDPAVVAEVKRKAAERTTRQAPSGKSAAPAAPSAPPQASGGRQSQVVPPRQTGLKATGKTARKKQKKMEKLRSQETRVRDAAAAVREYEAGGAFGSGPKRKKRRRREESSVATIEDTPQQPETIEMENTITVEELSEKSTVPVNDLLLDLIEQNIMATKNQSLQLDVVKVLMEKYGIQVRSVIPEETDILIEEPDDPKDLVKRAPVITVMGHVDHGKTSLLDYVRRANVAEGEVGGITQHIAAYDVTVGDDRVTFLDTPGHEAFSAMRARGAQATDVVVLVVAADDGVKPQTVEAIDHAKAAEVPIVVAVNKCDKEGADPDRVRQELSQYELVPEEWGGKTIMRNLSAKTGEGVNDLMEMLALEAELLELKANPNKSARGVVVESELSRGQGPVAWVLVQNGTLRTGDIYLAGTAWGRVRAMQNSRGETVAEAGPSTPVVVMGFDTLPEAGDQFVVVHDERSARGIAEKRQHRLKQKQDAPVRPLTLEDLQERLASGEKNELNVVLKSDVQGSAEVLKAKLSQLGNEEVSVNVVHTAVGGINESDVYLASASEAVIIGFHVTANARVKKIAEQEGVDIRTYRIIYEVTDDVKKALEGMLAPETKEVVTGHVEIRQVFRSSALGNIAGSYVTDGEVARNSLVRIIRDDIVVHEGKISSLKRNKDDAKSVQSGYECGIKLENYEDIKEGDVIEAYRLENVAKKLQ